MTLRDMNRQCKEIAGFTLIELIVVIALVLLLACLLLPSLARAKALAQRITCSGHLKQIGLAFKTWALDNQDHYPMQAPDSTNRPPNLTQLMQAHPMPVYAYQLFGVISNELVVPQLLACPSDNSPRHTNFFMVRDGTSNQPFAGQTTLCNLNLSYFLGRDAAGTDPEMLLAGDRNLYGGGAIARGRYDPAMNGGFGNSPIHVGVSFSPGFACAMGTNLTGAEASPCWTDKMHRRQGNVLLADGSVQELSTARLLSQLANSGDTSSSSNQNLLLFP